MFQQEMLNLRRNFLEEASLVEKMMTLVTNAISRHDNTLYSQISIYEDRVNTLEMMIDDDCTSILALYQPEASSLRQILMILKNNNDMERLGDQAVNIADSINKMQDDPFLLEIPELAAMGKATLKMLKDTIMAFTEGDTVLAKQVCERDTEVDTFNLEILRKMSGLMTQNPNLVWKGLHIIRIAKNLERVADLSTNIAENTIYMAQGRVIKHHNEE